MDSGQHEEVRPVEALIPPCSSSSNQASRLPCLHNKPSLFLLCSDLLSAIRFGTSPSNPSKVKTTKTETRMQSCKV